MAYQIRRALKERFPRVTVMIGGPHAKHYLSECKREGFDIIVVGDGERIFQEILLGDIKGLHRRLSPESLPQTLIFQDYLTESEMNNYPIPYRDKDYIYKYNYLLNNLNATTVMNSRGCPMGCLFCEDRRTMGRWFSPEHFEEEILDIANLGFKAIMIFDDLFTISPKKLRPYTEILKRFHKRIGLLYRCFGHAKVMAQHPEIATMLAESGCVELGFGAESASQTILDSVYKRTKTEELHNFAEVAIRAGIQVKAFFMIGLPGETEETYQETYDFIRKYRSKYPHAFDFDLSVFFPYKNTVIGDIARLAQGKTIIFSRQEVDMSFFKIRPRDGLSWVEIDNGHYGAYKKRGGDSDIVIETYDWQKEKVLLSAERIYELKEQTMPLSGRYSDERGKRIYSPAIEGNIGSLASLYDEWVKSITS